VASDGRARGGCRGGRGGNDAGGLPGFGGGAVEITAGGTQVLGGRIKAGGAGGAAGPTGFGGGGGGGAGGAVLIEAARITIGRSAAICANGGAGGEGAEQVFGGQNGANGTCSETEFARGGGSQLRGGDGGDGGLAGSPKGKDARSPGGGGNDGAGGGGGGGSVGRIRIHALTAPAMIDPQSTITPVHTL